MSNHRSNFALAAGVMLAITALMAGGASAASNHASGNSMKNHQSTGQSTTVRGIAMKPGNVKGLMPPGKVNGIIAGISKPPINGIWIPPKVPGLVIPPVTGVVINPPSIAVLPPEEVTWTRRRYPWYASRTVSTAQPVVTTAAAPCNCLTKEYLQDGSVLFKDLCTKEAAILTVEEMKAKM